MFILYFCYSYRGRQDELDAMSKGDIFKAFYKNLEEIQEYHKKYPNLLEKPVICSIVYLCVDHCHACGLGRHVYRRRILRQISRPSQVIRAVRESSSRVPCRLRDLSHNLFEVQGDSDGDEALSRVRLLFVSLVGLPGVPHGSPGVPDGLLPSRSAPGRRG